MTIKRPARGCIIGAVAAAVLAAPAPAGAYDITGDPFGTDARNDVTIRQVGNQVTVTDTAGNLSNFYGPTGCQKTESTVTCNLGPELGVFLGGGDDTLRVEGEIPKLVVYGGDGNDTLIGGDGIDDLHGDAGDDRIEGGGGADALRGGAGNDALDGADGADEIEGDVNDGNPATPQGHDTISGGAGNDALRGAGGSDTIEGGPGNDEAEGDYSDAPFGNDRISGGDGDDSLGGALGNDELSGDAGNDNVYTGGGTSSGIPTDESTSETNVASGGSGDDVVSGGDGADTLRGDDGNDEVTGWAGTDTIDGGDGNDLLVNHEHEHLPEAPDGRIAWPDTFACGPGLDRTRTGEGDTLAADCETLGNVVECPDEERGPCGVTVDVQLQQVAGQSGQLADTLTTPARKARWRSFARIKVRLRRGAKRDVTRQVTRRLKPIAQRRGRIKVRLKVAVRGKRRTHRATTTLIVRGTRR